MLDEHVEVVGCPVAVFRVNIYVSRIMKGDSKSQGCTIRYARAPFVERLCHGSRSVVCKVEVTRSSLGPRRIDTPVALPGQQLESMSGKSPAQAFRQVEAGLTHGGL